MNTYIKPRSTKLSSLKQLVDKFIEISRLDPNKDTYETRNQCRSITSKRKHVSNARVFAIYHYEQFNLVVFPDTKLLDIGFKSNILVSHKLGSTHLRLNISSQRMQEVTALINLLPIGGTINTVKEGIFIPFVKHSLGTDHFNLNVVYYK